MTRILALFVVLIAFLVAIAMDISSPNWRTVLLGAAAGAVLVELLGLQEVAWVI